MARKINDEYDIGKAFQAIEEELMASMVRNMKYHRAWEDAEGMHWEQWQALQLKALEKYKLQNRRKYGKQFKDINSQVEVTLKAARAEGGMRQEISILNAIKKGFPAKKVSPGASAEFFRLNDRKLDALIKATTNDMQKAETAVLRMANDQYRKVIFNAQVYANTGAGTYEKAVDMATKDMLSAGLNCVEYANGARHTLSDYADMAIRTASKRAYLQGEGQKRQEWGLYLVIMNKRGNPCPKCLPFVGKVLIDDVWSGGSKADGNYPLMSSAISAGLYHPRCKDGHTTYFPGISTPPDDRFTKSELEEIEKNTNYEAKQNHADRQIEKYDRMSRHSLDGENQKQYAKKADEWRKIKEPISINGVECTVTEESYDFGDGKGGVLKRELATIYSTPEGTKFVFPKNMDSNHQSMTPEQAIALWQKVPKEIQKKAQSVIEFVDYYNPVDDYWKKIYKNFTQSYATGGDKITFYRYDWNHDPDYVVRTYCHEAGHYIDQTLGVNKVNFSSEKMWTDAMKEDIIISKRKSPTEYGENANVEDFAESIAEYVSGRETFSRTFPNRAEIIKAILGM